MSAARYKAVESLRCAARKIDGYPDALENAFVDWLNTLWYSLSEDEMAEVDAYLEAKAT